MTTRREKTIAGVLVFFASVTLILGFVQIQKTLRASLLFSAPKKSAAAETLVNTSPISVDPAKDTDGDKLLDVDELNRYGTSPYLADSDSDGIADNIEITKGTDPNCPEGKRCGAVASGSSPTTKEQPKTLSDILEKEGVTANDATAPNDGTVAGERSTTSVAELRASLLASGVPKAQLDQIDDVTLLKMYQETEQDLQKATTKP